jgi:hypothetical protein
LPMQGAAGAARVLQCHPARTGSILGVRISRAARAVFGGAGSSRDINRCDPPHSITV